MPSLKSDLIAISQRHSRMDVDRDTARKALIELYKFILDGPLSLQRAYSKLPEAPILQWYEPQLDILSVNSLVWDPSGCSDEPELAACVGGQVRALDHFLQKGFPKFPNSTSDWLTDGHFVIPRYGRNRIDMSKGQPFEKRGLIYHRIIPQELLGYSVRVETIRNLPRESAADDAPYRMGAALFAGLKLTPDFEKKKQERRFVVTSVTCKDANQTIDAQVENAISESCFGVVWPELTVPPVLRERIQKRLANRDFSDSRPAPEIVVTGSWHEQVGSHYVNRTRIYDGFGVEKMAYDKIDLFVSREWGSENIVPGRELVILATAQLLVGFAICLDFCNQVSNPFMHLDLDAFLVPSMGNDETMRGHQATAKTLKVKFGALAFVVQQDDEAESDPNDKNANDTKQNKKTKTRAKLGMVLPLLNKPDGVPLDKLAQKKTWKSYIWETNAYKTQAKSV